MGTTASRPSVHSYRWHDAINRSAHCCSERVDISLYSLGAYWISASVDIDGWLLPFDEARASPGPTWHTNTQTQTINDVDVPSRRRSAQHWHAGVFRSHLLALALSRPFCHSFRGDTITTPYIILHRRDSFAREHLNISNLSSLRMALSRCCCVLERRPTCLVLCSSVSFLMSVHHLIHSLRAAFRRVGKALHSVRRCLVKKPRIVSCDD